MGSSTESLLLQHPHSHYSFTFSYKTAKLHQWLMISGLPSTQPAQQSPEGDRETSECIQVVKSPPTSSHYTPTMEHRARRAADARSILHTKNSPVPSFLHPQTKAHRHSTYTRTASFIIFSSFLHACGTVKHTCLIHHVDFPTAKAPSAISSWGTS